MSTYGLLSGPGGELLARQMLGQQQKNPFDNLMGQLPQLMEMQQKGAYYKSATAENQSTAALNAAKMKALLDQSTAANGIGAAMQPNADVGQLAAKLFQAGATGEQIQQILAGFGQQNTMDAGVRTLQNGFPQGIPGYNDVPASADGVQMQQANPQGYRDALQMAGGDFEKLFKNRDLMVQAHEDGTLEQHYGAVSKHLNWLEGKLNPQSMALGIAGERQQGPGAKESYIKNTMNDFFTNLAQESPEAAATLQKKYARGGLEGMEKFVHGIYNDTVDYIDKRTGADKKAAETKYIKDYKQPFTQAQTAVQEATLPLRGAQTEEAHANALESNANAEDKGGKEKANHAIKALESEQKANTAYIKTLQGMANNTADTKKQKKLEKEIELLNKRQIEIGGELTNTHNAMSNGTWQPGQTTPSASNKPTASGGGKSKLDQMLEDIGRLQKPKAGK